MNVFVFFFYFWIGSAQPFPATVISLLADTVSFTNWDQTRHTRCQVPRDGLECVPDGKLGPGCGRLRIHPQAATGNRRQSPLAPGSPPLQSGKTKVNCCCRHYRCMCLANAETAKPTTPSNILMIYFTISVLSVPVALLWHSTVREAIAILCPFNFSQSLHR